MRMSVEGVALSCPRPRLTPVLYVYTSMLRDQLERDQAATRKKLGELSAELTLKTEDVERARQRVNVDEKHQSIAARHAQVKELAQHKLHQEQRLQQLQVGSDRRRIDLPWAKPAIPSTSTAPPFII
jgi:hypothetical protein